jgi:hypothetical protein
MVRKYLRIEGLDEVVKRRIQSSAAEDTKRIDVDTASAIASSLPGKDEPVWDKKEQREVAEIVAGKPRAEAMRIISKLKERPDEEPKKVYEEIKQEEPLQFTIRFSTKVEGAFKEACRKEKIKHDILLVRIVEDWLRSHKYL